MWLGRVHGPATQLKRLKRFILRVGPASTHETPARPAPGATPGRPRTSVDAATSHPAHRPAATLQGKITSYTLVYYKGILKTP